MDRRIAALGLVIALASGLGLAAQSDGGGVDLRGSIHDAATGLGVERAEVFLPELDRGTVTSREGGFVIMGLPAELHGVELVVEHPCFHTVRVELERFHTGDPLELGLPYATPRMADGRVMPETCSMYGPVR